MRLKRIESREQYKKPNRISAVIDSQKSVLACYKEGRQVPDDKLGSDIFLLIEALNAAELQIKSLLNLINNLNLDQDTLQPYLDEYPEEDPKREKRYHLEDARCEVHYAMKKNDQAAISRNINRLYLLEEKYKIKI